MNPEYKVGMNDVILFNTVTGEKIMEMQIINASISDFTEVDRSMNGYFGNIASIEMHADWIAPEFLAYAMGNQNEPHIKRLINSRNKTKSKRIKKKINKEITVVLWNEWSKR